MERPTSRLRALLRSKTFLHMPSVYGALGGRLVQSLGFEAAYVGGYVTGGSSAVTEPLLTMAEAEYAAARQEMEDLIGLDEHYAVEAQTVEARRPR